MRWARWLYIWLGGEAMTRRKRIRLHRKHVRMLEKEYNILLRQVERETKQKMDDLT